MKKKLFIALVLINSISIYAYEILPKPQNIENGNSNISITDGINLVIENGTSNKSIERIKEVLEKHGIIFTETEHTDNNKTNILIGQYSGEIISDYANENGINLQVFDAGENKFDEHILEINNNSNNGDIVIIGNGKGSEYYAMATLDQILEQKEGNTLNTLTVNDYAYTQYRGIVEGFYGFPYPIETRLELLEFCKRYKMNAYIYGPKSDPYHLGLWKEEYPVSITEEQRYKGYITQEDIRLLSEKAISCNVKFTWAIHPALENGISFENESGIDQGVNDIMNKFKHMHELGVRSFGVFIDDMTYMPKGEMQARLADQTQKKLREEFGTSEENGVGELFFVPTAYSLYTDIEHNTLPSFNGIDKDVVIIFTGYGVWSDINKNDFDNIKGKIGRNASFWWNNPVNDNIDAKLFMRKLTTHYKIVTKEPIPSMGGLLINPMNQGCASKPALFSSAEYAWNPAAFDEDKSWEDFFSAEINEPEMADALKTFALNSDTDVEEQALINLYNTFKNEYQKGKLPSNAITLRDEIQKIYDACETLKGMESHQNKSYQMLYKEIKYWISKLKLMTFIIKEGLDFMIDNNKENWVKYTFVKDTKENLHTNPNVILTSLEGSGTKTTIQEYEATVGAKNMLPFVDFITQKIDDFALVLKDYSSDPYVITNMKNVPEKVLSKIERGNIIIEGLQGIKLGKDEFIGVNLGSLKEFKADASNNILDALDIEYSVNGKTWFKHENTNENLLAAYIRINNASSIEQEIDTNVLTYNMTVGTSFEKPTATTNMSIWESYKVDNVVDGNKETKFWSNLAQSAGQYILLDYGKVEPRGKITITFCTNDKPSGTIIVQSSEDNVNWNNVTEFTKSNINSNNEYVCNANNVPARYIRLYIKDASGPDWFQVAEISCEGIKQVFQAVNEAGEYVPCLSDRKLSSMYVPEKEGHIIYNTIECISVDTISVYHCYEFNDSPNAPSVSVLAGNEWKNIGRLNSTISKFNVSDFKDIEKIKIEWNSDNIPALVEVYPIGDPYKYNENQGSGINNFTTGNINIKVIGNCVSISGTDSKAAIYTLEGVCIYNGNDMDIVISAPGIYILNIEKHSQYIYIK